jgi:hypothetical protein
MKKSLRILLVLVVLSGIIFAAGSRAAWATPAARQPEAAAAKDNGAAPAAPIGSVQAPNCDGVRVLDLQEKSICGVALLTGQTTGTDVFGALNGMPGGFLSQAVTLYFTSGSLQICFAAPEGGTIFFQPSGTYDWGWVPTDLNNGFACATVSQNGDYALGPTPTPTPAP